MVPAVPVHQFKHKLMSSVTNAVLPPERGHDSYQNIMIFYVFSPGASERRVLLMVEVCHHIFSSSHLHRIFSSSHLLIFTSCHIFSHLLIFTSSLSCSLALLPSCPLALFSLLLFYLLRRGAVPTRQHEMQPFRTKWGTIGRNWSKIAIFKYLVQAF